MSGIPAWFNSLSSGARVPPVPTASLARVPPVSTGQLPGTAGPTPPAEMRQPREGRGGPVHMAPVTMAFPWQPLCAGRPAPAHPGPAASRDPPRGRVGQESVSAVLHGDNDTEQPQTAQLRSRGPNPRVCKIPLPWPPSSRPFLFPSSPFVVVGTKNLCFVFHMVLSRPGCFP